MIAFRKSVISCLVLVFSLTSAGGTDGDAAAREKAKAIHEEIQRQPMIFFVAKGGPNACGPRCSEWIAAEGAIDPNAAQRFRDFLGALAHRDLPIFFNSTGGIGGVAMVLGTVLREHRMTVGVGGTMPEGCEPAAALDEACRRVMLAKHKHRARLITKGARCVSACVHAFVGGSVRRVARDAHVGIHATRLLIMQSEGWMPVNDVHKLNLLKRYTDLVKSYMVEMGVDSGLMEAAAKVRSDRVYYLSRDEIARFGIETSGFYETRWMPYENFSSQFIVLKSITEAREADGKEYRTSNVRIWCVGGGAGIWLAYQREPWSEEMGISSIVGLAAGENKYVLRGGETKGAGMRQSATTSQEIVSGQIMARSEQHSIAVSWDFLRNAMAAPSLLITETTVPQGNTSPWSRAIKFSTNGLSEALELLQKNCGDR